MSENIQSISQGTYTIGQTSATNFIAGNGIKIDEPSAGTVRIGTDETVLFTSDWTDKCWNITLTEPISNFERIKMFVSRGNTNGFYKEPNVCEIDTSAINGTLLLSVDYNMDTSNIYRYFTKATMSGDNYKELSACMFQYNNASMTNWTTANAWCHPIKIIGINRKEV